MIDLAWSSGFGICMLLCYACAGRCFRRIFSVGGLQGVLGRVQIPSKARDSTWMYS